MAVCVLSDFEITLWLNPRADESARFPNCRDHRHVGRVEARKLCHGNAGNADVGPSAEWVGPRQIRRLQAAPPKDGRKVRLVEYSKEIVASDPDAGNRLWDKMARLYPLRRANGSAIRPRVCFGRCRRVSQ